MSVDEWKAEQEAKQAQRLARRRHEYLEYLAANAKGIGRECFRCQRILTESMAGRVIPDKDRAVCGRCAGVMVGRSELSA